MDYGKFIIGEAFYNFNLPCETVIFTMTMNRLDYTKRMIESLQISTLGKYRHIIVDQGSGDETVEYLYGLAGRTTSSNISYDIVFLDRNIGISAGTNLALDRIAEEYTPKYIVKIDNDCEILTSGWDETFKKLVSVNPKFMLSPYVEGLRENKGGVPRYSHIYIPTDGGHVEVGLTPHLGGIFQFTPIEAYKTFRYDEKDKLSGIQDSTFSAYLNMEGWLMGYVESVKCAHIDTTVGQHEKYPDYFKKRADHDSRVTSEDVDK